MTSFNCYRVSPVQTSLTVQHGSPTTPHHWHPQHQRHPLHAPHRTPTPATPASPDTPPLPHTLEAPHIPPMEQTPRKAADSAAKQQQHPPPRRKTNHSTPPTHPPNVHAGARLTHHGQTRPLERRRGSPNCTRYSGTTLVTRLLR